MKKLLNIILLLSFSLVMITSCTTVESGHKGIEVSWGGKTNTDVIYPEGM